MKNIEQVQSEEIGDVYTLEEFLEMVEADTVIPYDGYGYFHDGKHKTDICVWDDSITWDLIKDYPYVVWYNK